MKRMFAIGALMGLSMGCGGFEKSVYDIEMNEAELRAVPYVCDDGGEGVGGAWDVSARQRWTITAGAMNDARIEVPGFFRMQLERGEPDETPYIVNGSSSEEGPFQFLGLKVHRGETGELVLQRFYIDGNSLEADRIKGFVALRVTYSPDDRPQDFTCTSTVSFTGRRVGD